MEVLGLILARGGSKSIPKKNIRLLAGKPMLAYSIEQSLASKRITRTILTTDDEEIAAVGRQYGAEVPFLRPKELAEDLTPDLPVFQHALAWLKEHEGYVPDMLMHLRPTAPLRTPEMIDAAIDLLAAHPEADAVRSVGVPRDNPFKMWTIGPDGFLVPLLTVPGIAEPFNSPRQILPKVWSQFNYVDAIRTKTILEKNSMTGDRILPLKLELDEYVDIDSLFDWEVLEMLVRRRERHG